MKSLVDLFEDLLRDCGRRSVAPVAKDCEVARLRVQHEGISFLTLTLSAFARDFERSLETGQMAPSAFNGWKPAKGARYPAFLQGFVCRVFDKDGSLLAQPSIDCIRSVRQLCLFAKKVKLPCTKARDMAAIENYASCDESIVPLPDSQLSRYFKYTARALVRELHLDDATIAVRTAGRHGPGATQEGLSPNGKWTFPRWYRRLTDVGLSRLTFGLGRLVSNLSDLIVTDWRHVEPGEESPVKVTLVPKTLKTPRVIAVEPSCMQFAQQALSRILIGQLGNCPLTSGRVNFRDQSINQELAVKASEDGSLATLDMSDASDRVKHKVT